MVVRGSGIAVLARIVAGLLVAMEGSAERGFDAPPIDLQFGGFVLVIPEAVSPRENVLNRDNQLGVPTFRTETAIVLEGSIEGLSWRLRGTATPERANGDWDTEWNADVQELARSFDLGRDWQLVIGKRTLSWDVGSGFLPLGFFQKEIDFSDLEDRYGRTEGLPLVGLTYFGSAWDLSAVYSWDFENDQDGFNRGLRQWAVNANLSWRGTRFSAVIQQPEDQRVGFGAAFSMVLGAEFEVHGSGFARRGTRRPIHRLVDRKELGFIRGDPFSDARIHDSRWYPRSLLGIQWTGRSKLSLIVEWFHDARGLDDGEWDHWQDLIAFHDRQVPGVPREARQANLAQDARILLRTGTRQNYLFVHLRRPFGDIEATVSTIVDLAGASAFVNGRIVWSPPGRWSADLFFNAAVGPSGSEYRMTPLRWSGGLSVIFRF